MKKTLLKPFFAATVFAVTFLGIRISQQNVKVANEEAAVTTFSLGTQAQAYCNEAKFPGETNEGHCTGALDNVTSRCLSASTNQDCFN